MGLDGGLGDIEFESDLLVEQAFGEHVQHPELLRRERGNGLGKARVFLVGLTQASAISSGNHTSPSRISPTASAISASDADLGMKPEAP